MKSQRLCCAVILIGWLTVTAIGASLGDAIVRGRVLDQQGAAIVGAVLTLSNSLSGYRNHTQTGENGGFAFFNVPQGHYLLKVECMGFVTVVIEVEVHSDTPLEIPIVLRASGPVEVVEVAANPNRVILEDDTGSHYHIDKSFVERFPTTTANRSIESILLSVPGFIADSDGRLHFRGSHGQLTYIVDGQPISDMMHISYANNLDARNVEAMEVFTGLMPAEFGYRNAAVVSMTTRSGLGSGRRFFGDVMLGVASFDTGEIGARFSGQLANRFGYFVSLAGSKSNRFLDPPNFENLHNGGNTQRLFARLDYTPNHTSDFLRLNVMLGRSHYQVPNLLSQHLAGQNQRQKPRDLTLSFNWLRIINSRATIEITPYYRTSIGQLLESPFDTPLLASQARHLTNVGGNIHFSFTSRSHRFKTGVQLLGFPISENFSFAITDPSFNVPPKEGGDPHFYNVGLRPYDLTRGGSIFHFSRKGTGSQYSFFVQDEFRYGDLTLSTGLRYDYYRFLVREDAWQPRIGFSYRIGATGTVLRGSYNRLFFTPPNENLLFSSSAEAAELSGPAVIAALGSGMILVPSERQHVYEVGLQQRVKDWFRVDAAYYTKDARNVHENLQFLLTRVIFPVAIHSGKMKGFDMRIDVPEHRGFSGYLSLGTSSAIVSPPFTGGLFVDKHIVEHLDDGPFRIDHDQKISAQWGVMFNDRRGRWWTGVTGRHDSGLVTEVESPDEVENNPDLAFGLAFVDFNKNPFRVKPRTIWDWSLGLRLRGESRQRIEFQFHILNLTNKKGLYNFLSHFGGTHVIPPRQYVGRMTIHF